MNFYASRDFLDAAAAVHCKGQHTAIEDVAIGSEVLRLLIADGRPVTTLRFLDVHQPLAAQEITRPQAGKTLRKARFARHVVRGVIPCSDGKPEAGPNHDLAPFVDWSGFASFEAYKQGLQTRHKGLVKDRERRGRSLASHHGALTFTVDDTAEDVLPLAQRWKREQLRATGHTDYFATPEAIDFFAALRARGVLVTSTLRTGGRLAAVWIGFIHDRVWSGWVFTYDPAFKKYSAGHQLLSYMLEESFRRGHREFDFSEGGEDYKMLYATHARLLGDIGRPPLRRSLITFAKAALHRCNPKWLVAVQGHLHALRHALTANAQPSQVES
jgi:CelD/BcsL family acetyltransferase involved in cellulose biosynthesis